MPAPQAATSQAAAPLPIDEVLPALHAVLAERGVAVLEAPPGAGKTTRVPLALLHAPWLESQRIVMLEPRRLAARAAASYMARTLGEPVGGTVGYRVRGDTRISSRTRIEVVTEGILTRMLSQDPTLDGIGAVLFDEFHERSLHADLGLALVLETQQQLRESLRVLVMSATLDGEAVAQLMADAIGPAPRVRSSGRIFPITTHYRPPRPDERMDAVTARVVREALVAESGDLLVFLPGLGEQRRVAERLTSGPLSETVKLHVLHGTMPLADQDAALAPAPPGGRKVVLTTNVAETSLTVEGVRVVVDAGWSRVPRHDPSAGLTRLHTMRVSRASADQRRGRAGRLGPGVCYRLWDPHEEHGFLPQTRPEIIDADLSALALELADAGITDPAALRWLDRPRAGPFAAARELLTQLEALDAKGRITPHGRRMAALPLAPRLAHLVLTADTLGQAALGTAIAALLEERDLLRGEGRDLPSDLDLRLDLLRRDAAGGQEASLHGAWADRDGLRRVRQAWQDLLRRMDAGGQPARRDVALTETSDAGHLLALAFPDRVAQRRPGAEPRFLLRNGTGGVLSRHDPLREAPYLAVAELDGSPPDFRIVRAAALTRAAIEDAFAQQLTRCATVAWDARAARVQAVERVTLGALVLDERPVRDLDPERVREAVLAHLGDTPVSAWPWSAAAHRLRERLACANRHLGAAGDPWPDVADTALHASVTEWLGPFLDGVRTQGQLEAVDWAEALASMLPWAQRSALDRLLPTHLEVPSGSRIALDYSDPEQPVLAVKLQEVFGWTTTPCVLDGRVPVTLHLLSPAQRPVQVTRDLAGFWASGYFEVRKELRGRYPRHPWPEDPLSATPTRRAKPRGT
jgi:ATP-dependent helicase HrpB